LIDIKSNIGNVFHKLNCHKSHWELVLCSADLEFCKKLIASILGHKDDFLDENVKDIRAAMKEFVASVIMDYKEFDADEFVVLKSKKTQKTMCLIPHSK